MPKKEDLSIKLLRHLLGSIDLSDVEDDKEMSESERMNYCSQIFAVFPVIEKDIKKLLYTQLMFSNNNAENWEQVLFSRGTFNGLDLLLEKWRVSAKEYEAKGKENPNPTDINNPMPEL